MTYPDAANPNFPTTRWTLIGRLRDADEAVVRRALGEICALYHFPLYCYARRRGLAHHDAEDALQDFFAKLLRNESLRAADGNKGNLRCYLAAALGNHLVDWQRTQRRQAGSGDATAGPQDNHDERFQRELFREDDSPERILDRQWARELLARVLADLGRGYSARGKGDIFSTLLPVLLDGGSLRGHDTARLAATLGMKDGTLRVTLSRLLRDFRNQLELEILQTVATRADANEEIRHLLRGFQEP